jgi:tetratricopeptide (TPR) repeat protein
MEGALAKLAAEIGEPLDRLDPAVDKAQNVMCRAWETANPAKRLSLAHQALKVSPNCADAYVLLAEEEADTLARAETLYRQGVAAGERALGAAYFDKYAGEFWGLLETRPYMRARAGLANTLWSLKRVDEATEHYFALLELNPGDNQGLRYLLLDLLLDAGRDDEARKLIKRYDEEAGAEWNYTRDLLEFRQGGAAGEATRRLKKALKQNKFVSKYLTGEKRIPPNLPGYYGYGDDAEAVHYAHRYLRHWRGTAGAVDWLKSKA